LYVGLLFAVQNVTALLTYLPIGRMTAVVGLQPFIGLTFIFFALFPLTLAVVPDGYGLLIPVLLLLVWLIYRWRRERVLWFGTIFFALNIALLLQLNSVGQAMRADRYAYLPGIGWVLMVVVIVRMSVERSFGPRARNGVLIAYAMVVNPTVPANSVADLVALAKAKPGALNYGSLGVGSGPHLSMEALQAQMGVKLTAVHYKGAAPALTDVVAGHIPMMFVSTGLIAQPWKAGQLRPLGVGSAARLPQFPDLPAIAESMPGFTAVVWFGLFAPAGTPAPVVAKINDAVQQLLKDTAFRERIMVPNFYEPVTGSPDTFAARVREDTERWRRIVTDAKIAIQD